ncbi:DUF2752 domain-containing protein [Hymenobacter profundi]|uniref:DUF2752 domain-containing protein n=1 Tax=Hymenobacter profundi TaxID=1982110 RepID=A0ABS6X1M2_9BACT|nr:DUF2752 domain-containing protein [Hymenobacter profundi]
MNESAEPRWGKLASLLVLGGVGLLLLYFRLNPAHYPFPRCPVHWLTGLHCPGCGTQRALHALLHGRVGQAVHYNLLAVGYAPVVVVGAFEEAWLRGGASARRTSFLYSVWFGWLTVGGVVLFTILRNLPTSVGYWLAP